MAVFEALIQSMVNSGAYYVFIWLLFAALIYGFLEKYEILGESSAAAGVSLGASFFTLLGIYAFAPPGIFLNLGAAIGFSLFALFGAAILLSMAGVDVSEFEDGIEGNPLALAGGLLILISFIGVLAYNMNWGSLLGNVENMYQDVVFPILFLVFLLIIVAGALDNS